MENESTYDRMAREEREKAEAQKVTTEEQARFVFDALLPFVEKITQEVQAGLTAALGPASIEGSASKGPVRAFRCWAESPGERATANIDGQLHGQGPEYTDATKVHYALVLNIHVRPRIGVPFGKIGMMRVDPKYYGPGQPGVSAKSIEEQVIAEIQRVKKYGQ